jgi:hypothetical protein
MYCSVCAVRAADRDNNQELKEMLAPIFMIKCERIACEGCRSEKPFQFAVSCAIRTCAGEKNLESCHQCQDFPCGRFSAFPFEISKQQMLAALPRWKRIGDRTMGRGNGETFYVFKLRNPPAPLCSCV